MGLVFRGTGGAPGTGCRYRPRRGSLVSRRWPSRSAGPPAPRPRLPVYRIEDKTRHSPWRRKSYRMPWNLHPPPGYATPGKIATLLETLIEWLRGRG